MAILVTGGAGFIGSHTCADLLDAGHDIVILDNYSNASPTVIGKIEAVSGKKVKAYETDLLDADSVAAIFAENDIDAVIHFAGLKAVAQSVSMPLQYYRNNITGTLILLDAMAKAGCKKLVFSSSATVYGANPDVPLKETYPTRAATNPYGTTKLMIETILRDLYTSDNSWSIALLRYFNPIGAHPSGLLGEVPNGIPNNIMPIIVQVVSGKLPILNVTGNDYDTPDGTGVRDYLHVMDLAAGHKYAYDYVCSHTGVDAFNLGTGKGYSVLDIVTTFEAVNNVQIPRQFAPRRPGDIAVSYADPTKAKDILGWEATRDLQQMCRDAWHFYQKETAS